MKWKHNKQYFKPKARDTRIKKAFLFFPKRIEDETVWLEFAEWKEEYINVGKLGGKVIWKWVPLKWEWTTTIHDWITGKFERKV